MRDLIVVGFERAGRATEVLNQLLDLNENRDFDLHLEDAVAVYRTRDGRLRVDQSVKVTRGEGAKWGGALGAIIGALFAVPLIGASAVAAAAVAAGALTGGTAGAVIGGEDAAGEKERYGISDDFVQRVGGMVQPGQSAVFILAESDHPQEVVEQFRGRGGTILRTTLRPEQERQLQQVIGADRPVTR